MANIDTLLTIIKTAVYGKDMRSAIHDSIKAVNDDVEKREPQITKGTKSQYWRGDKIFSDFDTSVRKAILTGLSTAVDSIITETDSILEAFGKLQAQVSNRLKLTGGTMSGSINMGSHKISSTSLPSSDTDYTNKQYVDSAVEKLEQRLRKVLDVGETTGIPTLHTIMDGDYLDDLYQTDVTRSTETLEYLIVIGSNFRCKLTVDVLSWNETLCFSQHLWMDNVDSSYGLIGDYIRIGESENDGQVLWQEWIPFHIVADDVLTKTNVTPYTPTKPYHPATKRYVDEHGGGGGASTPPRRVYALHSRDEIPSQIQDGDICFIWDQYESGLYPEEPTGPIQAAVYTNMTISEDEPENAEYWGKIVSESKEGIVDVPTEAIVSGDMEVAEEPSGTKTFFNEIN